MPGVLDLIAIHPRLLRTRYVEVRTGPFLDYCERIPHVREQFDVHFQNY